MTRGLKIYYLPALLLLTACSTAYYGALEKVGIHKREILVDRVEDAKVSQQQAQQQFSSALEQLTLLSGFDGGAMEEAYETTREAYEGSEAAAGEVSKRIKKIENVAQALFSEWEQELEQYSSAKLQRDSRNKLEQTQSDYKLLLAAMQRTESKMQPVLAALRDNMLYLKHNLNARAVAGLQGEFSKLKLDIRQLIDEMNMAIIQSDNFIARLKQ